VQLRGNGFEGPEQPPPDIHSYMLSVDRESVVRCRDRAAHGSGMSRGERTETRTLATGLEVSAVGYGAMALIGLYGEVDEERGLAALRHALSRGVTLVDTADAYGIDGSNERLVGRAISDRRDEIVVATKWGIAPPRPPAHRVEASYANEIWIDARPERAHEAAEASLRRLATEAIDLWYLHFPDPGVPIEETVGAMAGLVADGKVRHLGLSNVTGAELRRAHAIHPIAAVQAEYSLWTRTPERNLLPVTRKLGIGLVAWGPLGNGFLAGSADRLSDGDFRHNAPRFQQANLQRNIERFTPLRSLAEELAITPAQLALAWLLHQGEDIVPIPGSRDPDHIDSNLESLDVRLSADVLEQIEQLAPVDLAVGAALL
jgi:aryl-alcohol dehydrogenase-like predicted oxidoreductase